MNPLTLKKLYVDIAMMASYIILMFGYDLGGLFHEILGLAFGVFFLLHILLNIKNIKCFFTRLKKRTLKPSQAISLICDVLLVPSMIIVIVTGVLTSKTLFDSDRTVFLVDLHNVMSWFCLAILSIHLVLHLKYLYKIIRAFATNSKTQLSKKTGNLFLGIALVLGIIGLGGVLDTVETAQAATRQAEAIIAAQSLASKDREVAVSSVSTAAATSSQQSTSPEAATRTIPTLTEYLSGLTCTECKKACPLSSPLCSDADPLIAKATADYHALYGV